VTLGDPVTKMYLIRDYFFYNSVRSDPTPDTQEEFLGHIQHNLEIVCA